MFWWCWAIIFQYHCLGKKNVNILNQFCKIKTSISKFIQKYNQLTSAAWVSVISNCTFGMKSFLIMAKLQLNKQNFFSVGAKTVDKTYANVDRTFCSLCHLQFLQHSIHLVITFKARFTRLYNWWRNTICSSCQNIIVWEQIRENSFICNESTKPKSHWERITSVILSNVLKFMHFGGGNLSDNNAKIV